MEIITSHQRADFDALAAMVAAHKVYPQAIPVFSGKLTKNVKKFMALYRDVIDIKYASSIDKTKVDKVIMVDTRVAARVGAFAQLVKRDDVEVLIYDHHLRRKNVLKGATEIIKPVGAATTILVNILQKERIVLDSFEATLFALGIYEDTGSLIYKSTTVDDLEAVAYLLERGANLEVVEEYIEYSLDRKQQQLFNKLLDSLHQVLIKGFEVDLFKAEVDEYIPDIALLAHKLNELHNADALFVLVKYKNKVLIIARSNHDNINVAQILNYFGGGGHDRASSATIKNEAKKGLIYWQQELLAVVREKITPSVLVKDIMSTPVRTISSDSLMKEADEMMLRYGYSGLIVEDDDHIVGVISSRDVAKVRNHGLLHAPVKGYMSTDVVVISKQASLKEVQTAIVKNNVGRLPVVDESGELVGIVTRSDLLSLLYGRDGYHKNRQNLYGQSLVKIKERRYDISDKLQVVDQWIIDILKIAGEVADEQEFDLYIVGGFVRDLLLDKINYDLDLVVEGDGIEFARELSYRLKGVLDIYPQFFTASISLNNIKLDIASTRIEYYSDIASLPDVEPGSIKQDLFRRDFSINALAIQLNSSSFGQLVDYFGGKGDLEKGIIRLLHNFSPYDDPTRVFRGIRFASRYNYKFEAQTRRLIKQAIELDVVDKLSPNRLFNKLKIGLKDENPIRFINLLKEYNILAHISDDITWDKMKIKLAEKIPDGLEYFFNVDSSIELEEWSIYLLILFMGLDEKDIKSISNTFNLDSNLVDKLLLITELEEIITDLQKSQLNSSIYNLLDKLPIEILLLIMIKESSIKDKVLLYLQELKEIEIKVSGEDIIDLGYKPGPLFSQAMEAVKEAKLNGDVSNYQQELDYIRSYMKRTEE